MQNNTHSAWSYEEAFSRNRGLICSSDQERLRKCRVAIAGLGGVGGGHAVTLARLGVGSFHLVDDSPNTTVLVAKRGTRIVGTVSLTLDSPTGPGVDGGFRNEYLNIRDEGGKLGIVWRLATAKAHRQNSHLVIRLLQAAFRLAQAKDMTTCLLCVAKRHVRFFKSFFNARPVHEGRFCFDKEVDTSAVLMRIDAALLPKPLS